MKCPRCDKENPPDNRFCDNCGFELVSPTPPAPTPVPAAQIGVREVTCPSCGHVNPADSSFCEQCGATITAAPPVKPPTAVPTPTPPPSVPVQPPTQPTVPVVAPKVEGALILPDGNQLSIGARKVLGRVDLAKYASPDEAMWISRQHFTIFLENDRFYIQDDGSTNGTKLNGVEIKDQGKQELRDCDEILVGDAVKLSFRGQGTKKELRRNTQARIEITEVSGIGPKRAEQLRSLGINTAHDLASASPESLAAKTGISPKITEQWIEQAKKLMKQAS